MNPFVVFGFRSSKNGKPKTERLFGSRVSLVVVVLEAVGRHMGVNLCVRQAAMSQEFLDAADVGAAVEQMRGKAVPQTMRAGVRIDAGQSQVFCEQPAHTAAGQPGAVFVEEDGLPALPVAGAAI